MDRPQRPFFRPGVRGVDKGFGEIDLAAIAQVLGESLEQAIQPATALPLLKAAMAGLIGRIPPRQIVPRRAGPQHPEHAVQDGPRVGPRPPAMIGAPTGTKRGFEHGPLGVSEVHAVEYDGHRNFVHNPALGFMR